MPSPADFFTYHIGHNTAPVAEKSTQLPKLSGPVLGERKMVEFTTTLFEIPGQSDHAEHQHGECSNSASPLSPDCIRAAGSPSP
jgi:hypothetical protein